MSGVPVQAIVLEIVDEIDWCMGPNAKCTDLPFGGLMVLIEWKINMITLFYKHFLLQ